MKENKKRNTIQMMFMSLIIICTDIYTNRKRMCQFQLICATETQRLNFSCPVFVPVWKHDNIYKCKYCWNITGKHSLAFTTVLNPGMFIVTAVFKVRTFTWKSPGVIDAVATTAPPLDIRKTVSRKEGKKDKIRFKIFYNYKVVKTWNEKYCLYFGAFESV